jgi:hypothetical protein
VELWNTILADVKAAKTAEAFKNGYANYHGGWWYDAGAKKMKNVTGLPPGHRILSERPPAGVIQSQPSSIQVNKYEWYEVKGVLWIQTILIQIRIQLFILLQIQILNRLLIFK